MFFESIFLLYSFKYTGPISSRRYLKNNNFYLQDSNFDPDFVQSAISASNIYNLETGENPDGIIGIDLYFFKYLLIANGGSTCSFKFLSISFTLITLKLITFEFLKLIFPITFILPPPGISSVLSSNNKI